MSNINKAKEILQNGGFTCVLTDGEKLFTSNKRGVAPLLEWYDSGNCFKNFSAADKVVGKAAAFLYVLLGVKEVFALVISKAALSVFEDYKIPVEYAELVPAIKNRTNTGFCPMESATKDVENPQKAVEVVKNKLRELSK